MTYKCKYSALLAALLVSCFATLSSTFGAPYFPGSKWETRSPESQRIDSKAMDQALQYLKSKCFEDGLNELLIIRNGYIVFSGPDVEKSHGIYSCSKSFTSTVFGLLIEEGKVNLDTRACKLEPSLKEHYSELTLRHFTTMTSGYNAVGSTRWEGNSEDWSWTPYQPDRPLFCPGTAYAYWDEAQMMFARCLTIATGESLKEVFDRRIADQIEFGNWQWLNEGEWNGIPINNGCTNVIVNAKQLARFGLLFLNEGEWDGEQLISKSWVKEATNAQVSSTLPIAKTDRSNVLGSGAYGYNWWVNGGQTSLPDAPEKTFYASGLRHNVCFVVPEWNMVIVRMGEDGNPPEGKHVVWNDFLKRLTQAIQ